MDVLRQYANRIDLLNDLDRTTTRLYRRGTDGTADIPEVRSATRPQPHALSARLTEDDLVKLAARYQEGATQKTLVDETGLSLSSIKRLLRKHGARRADQERRTC